MPSQKSAIQPETPTNTNISTNASALQFRLRTTLIVPLVLQVITVVGLVSYLYSRNEQKVVDDIAAQSRQEIAVRVEQNLRSYLAIPHLVNQNNAVAINLGQLNLKNLSRLEQYFWRQLQVFDTLTFIGLGFENRDHLGAERADDGSLLLRVATQSSSYDFGTYSTNQRGERLQLLHHKPNFDPRTCPWYKAAVAAGRPVWSQICLNTSLSAAYLGASLPFYNEQGDLQGVLLSYINLSQISRFLESLKIGKTGQVFIIERSGLLVATSTGEKPFRTVQKEFGAERVKAIDSSNALTQATVQYLTKNFSANGSLNIRQSELFEFNNKGEREFLQVLPFRDQYGLDWLIVVVIPESDFTGQIAANTLNTIHFTLLALIAAIALGVLTAHRITRPILRVSQGAKAIAKGDLEQHVASSNIIEIESLTRSFNSMVRQLQTSFTALKQSEIQNRAIVEALPDLLFRARGDGTYVDNPIGRTRLKGIYAGERSLAGVNIYDSLPPQQAQQRIQAIQRALQTGKLQVYEHQLVINDETIEEEVRVVKIADDEVLIMVRDVTDRKHQKEILEARVEERTTELANANAALKASEAELQGLFTAMDDVIIVYDRQGTCLKIASTNPGLLLKSSEEMIGQSVRDLLPKAQADLQLESIQQVLETRQTITIEYSLFIGHGSASSEEHEAWFSANLSPLSDDTVIMVARDITKRKQVEKALQASEAELRALFAAMTDIVVVKDSHGRYCKIAPTNPSNLLTPDSGLLGLTEHDILPKPQADLFVNHIQQVLRTQQTISIDYCLNIEQRDVWFTANVSPLAADTVVWVARDISERKQAEARLQAQQAFLRQVIDAVPGSIFVKDREGHFLVVNQSAAAIYGVTVEEMLGKTDMDFNADPEAVEQYLADNQEVIATRQTKIFPNQAIQNRHGELRWYQTSISPFVDAKGEVQGVIGALTDITERKRTEAALQESERKYRKIFENSQVGIGRTRIEDGLFLDANQRLAEILGYSSAAELIGQISFSDLYVNPEDRQQIGAELRQQGGVRDYELHLHRSDNSTFWGLLSVQFDLEESSTEFFITDISDRKQAELELQETLNQLAAANQEITVLNQRLASENFRMSAELEVTRQLQQMILPKAHELNQIEGLEISGFMEPAAEVGGDYYDVITHNGRVKIGMGDVTGHGLESGVLMLMLQTAVRTLLMNHETDPVCFLNVINQVIYENTRRMNSDKNLSLTLLDYQAGHVRLSGQHEEVLVVRSDGQVERMDTFDLGFLLGIVPDIREFVDQAEIMLQPGDGIVLYTDGITEAENSAGEYYGLERLCQFVSRHWQCSADEIRRAIVEDVRSHIGNHKVYDDITLLILKQK